MVFRCVYVLVQVQMCILLYMYLCACMYIQVQMCVWLYVCLFACVCAGTCVYAVHLYAYVCAG